MLTIAVPSYNSLEYLRILNKGIRRNTKIPYELIVHDNGSTDGTQEWIRENKVSCTRSESNLGFTGVNCALVLASHPYTIIMNTDMYPLPGWDLEIFKQIEKFKQEGVKKFTISSCLIEPLGANPEYNIFYAGHNAETFNEPLLLGTYLKEKERGFKKENTTQYSHPILAPTEMWEEMNYLDDKYYPGWAVDHDLAAQAYKVGCRDFLMLGTSRVYHFISKTFTKLPSEVRNRSGQDIFQNKWGISVDEFRRRLGVATPYRTVNEHVI